MICNSRAALLALSALALLSNPAFAQQDNLRKKTIIVDNNNAAAQAPSEAQGRQLDASWTLPPTDKPTNKPKPTKRPTKKPTRKPTRKPTARPTQDYRQDAPDVCGTLPCTDIPGLNLGPFKSASWARGKDAVDCNNEKGHWHIRTAYSPMFAYKFALTKTCEYQYLAPEHNNQWQTSRDVNSWFEQMAIILKREGHKGYKASDDDHIFNGNEIPVWNRDVSDRNIDNCPEKYCVQVRGPAVSRQSVLAGAETHSPTEQPTPSPSQSPTMSPTDEPLPLKEYGNSAHKKKTLELCEGDCDKDYHCEEGLVCFQRNGYEAVPGCKGKGSRGYDYCIRPQTPTKKKTSDTTLTIKGNNGSPKDAFPLGMCQGDCDRDEECQEGLLCQQRNGFEPVPGCEGRGSRGYDYCHKPEFVDPNQPTILYAFSHEKAWIDFKVQLKSAMDSREKDHIFLTNHFKRCGCESFCMEQDRRWGGHGATCYVEPRCGYVVYQIRYDDDFPIEQRVSWASYGTTEVMKWFDACAAAMYGCTEYTNFDKKLHTGTSHQLYNGRYKGTLKVYKHDHVEVSPLPFVTTWPGNNPVEHYPLGMCEGDCDNDSQCQEGLICQQRNAHEPIPGCQGVALRGYDYCRKPDFFGRNVTPLKQYGTSAHKRGKLQNCEGDCDHDSHCAEGLKCFQRNNLEPVPGCAGKGDRSYDYCYEPGAAAPTSAPTPYVSISNYENVYGLGGDKYYGLPGQPGDRLSIGWYCPEGRRDGLEHFGSFVNQANLWRYAGDDDNLPPQPCPEEEFYEPKYPELDPVTPGCEEIGEQKYCHQTNGATCFARVNPDACNGVELVMMNTTSTYVFDDVAEWNDACIAMAGCHRRENYEKMDGVLTYKGRPNGVPYYSSTFGWSLGLYNERKNKKDTVYGNKKTIYYTCNDWQSAFAAANFTDGAGNKYDVFGNDFGDLYEQKACTDHPTQSPTLYPTISPAPTDSPSQNPTFCAESYLTSEDLNIALVIDLSFSTYEKLFSAENPVGDANGDGKENTILDAQVVAIQELLVSIAKSPTLNNGNTEISLISFSTSAKDHGVWAPLNKAGTDYNSDLMNYIKKKLRAPTSSEEVRTTNNGFTNFDAALDTTVEYFKNKATKKRKNLMVFLSDGEPNVRGDGDEEGYCSDTATFWKDKKQVKCADLKLEPGVAHTFCTGDNSRCSDNKYQDCVRGPNECMNKDAVTQYTSEIKALTDLNVERLAIGVGNDSNVAHGSALWKIDNNPAKYKGVLPLQALNLDELSEYLSSLCILNTEPPTGSPSAAPTDKPTVSPAPSSTPTDVPTSSPTKNPTDQPTTDPTSGPTGTPTLAPTTKTAAPTTSPTSGPTGSPSGGPTDVETVAPFIRNRDDPVDDKPYVPPEGDCPSDIVIASQKGTTSELPTGSVRIVSQDTKTVTVQIVQSFSKKGETIDGLYYQYQYSEYSTKCWDEDGVYKDDTYEVTIQCRDHSPIAILELWYADDLKKGSLSADDQAEIPNCCHPAEPEGTPAAHYVLIIKCKTECPDAEK